jgi:hypothetical protein
MNLPNKLNIIFALAIIALVAINIKTCGEKSDFEKLTFSQSDTIQSYINNNGQQVSTIAIMQGTVADFKKLNANKDSTIAHMQKLIDKPTISATVHGTVTGNSISSGSTITKYDTVHINDSIKVFPQYATKFKNKWENFDVTATKDSISIKYKLYNEFDYVVRYNKQKWYKARVPEITVTNLNPNTETVELKNFSVKPPKNQKLLVFLGGATVGTGSTIGIIILVTKLFIPHG